LLYSIFARIGGSGLDTDAFETLRASFRGGFLGTAVAYDNRQRDGAKVKTPDEAAPAAPPEHVSWFEKWKAGLLLERQRFIEEYDLADVLLVLSETAADTFRVQGFEDNKLFYLPRGVDVDRFKPGRRPVKFRAIFSGALIKRKGIHHLLEAWDRLKLPEAELWLVGAVHEEAKPFLRQFCRDNVRVIGSVRDPENYLNQATVQVFPSQLEGSAKVTYEAAACALPQITTREAGDVVRDGIEGIIVKPGDVDAIAAAIEKLYRDPELVEQMGQAARRRVVENFTWDHFRARLLDAYAVAIQRGH
jgi:glycosyltransferase involved in cell wall biosynthesis